MVAQLRDEPVKEEWGEKGKYPSPQTIKVRSTEMKKGMIQLERVVTDGHYKVDYQVDFTWQEIWQTSIHFFKVCCI